MRIVLFILALLASPTLVQAESFMSVRGAAEPLYGYAELCRKQPRVCRSDNRGQQHVTLSETVWRDLEQVTAYVNRLIVPTTDVAKHRVRERWELLDCLKSGDCRGDCEEYVLMKRQLLLDSGWPVSALLITTVYDEKNEGHAVLTVRTNVGDFILDNKTDEVLRWDHTPYVYAARQSAIDPKAWFTIEPSKAKPQSVAVSSWSKGTSVQHTK